MSISKPRTGAGFGLDGKRRRSAATHDADAAGRRSPLTTSRAPLLDHGSDGRFRGLIHDLFTVASRMELVREHLGRRIGVSGPQYSVLMAIAHLQGARGTSVGTVAQALHVSSAFITAETGKLARLGLVLKRTNPADRRGVLLSLATAGCSKIEHLSAEVRAVNDRVFGLLDAKSFAALCAAAGKLVEGSNGAVEYIASFDDDAVLDAAS
jgi:MarR family transcriptional regulator, organic hydroperoxide resistance regulator